MMLEMQYYIYEINGKKRISVFFCEKGYEVLSCFLSSEVLTFEKWIKEIIDKVLSGQSSYEELEGNVCYAEVRPLQTVIYNSLLKDEEYYSTSCEVDTRELRQLIEEWCVKVQEFRREQKLIQQFKECREKYMYFKAELEGLCSKVKENAEDKSVYEKIGMLFGDWLDFSENEYASVIFQYGIEKKLILKKNSTEECKLWKDIFGTEFELLNKEKRHMLIELVEKQSEYSVCNDISF